MKTIASMLAAVAMSATAATSPSTATVAADAPRQGVIEEVEAGSALRVNGTRYAFSLLSANVHDRQGKRIDAPRLAAGKTIAYTVSNEGSTPRIKQIWIID